MRNKRLFLLSEVLQLSLLISQRGIVIETRIERSGRVVPIDGIDKKANALSII